MKAHEFKEIRERLGLSQDQLAEVLCLSGKQAVSNIETGFRNPSRLAMVVMSILRSLSEKKAREMISLLLSHGEKAKGRVGKSKRG